MAAVVLGYWLRNRVFEKFKAKSDEYRRQQPR